MIALAIYFCIADTVLITQVLYYRTKNSRERKESIVPVVETEEEPLLSRRRSSDSTGLPGSHQRRLSTVSMSSRRSNILENIAEEGLEEEGLFKKNAFTILAVVAVGVAGWGVAWQSGVWVPAPVEDVPAVTESPAGASILGYISAVCYLG